MRTTCFVLFFWLSLALFSQSAFASEGERKRARSLVGTPVNLNIAGGGTLPKGAGLTMLNASFADRTRSKRGGGDLPDTFSQVWLLKIRYGVTGNFEIGTVLPYINNSRSHYEKGPEHIEGVGDVTLQATWAFFNQHQGDPFSLSLGVAALLPTGLYGKNHIPGNGVWGGRIVAAAGWWPNRDVRMDTELVWTGPFERGNQKVKRGDQWQWNAFARRLFDAFDIGLESSMVFAESGDKRFDEGTRNLRNGFKEWYVGPSMNFAVDSLGAWVGIGAFFPVMQEAKGPAKVDNVRFDFKIGLMW